MHILCYLVLCSNVSGRKYMNSLASRKDRNTICIIFYKKRIISVFLWKTSCSFSIYIHYTVGYCKFSLTDCDVLFRRLYILARGGAVRVRSAWFSRTEPNRQKVHWKSEVGFWVSETWQDGRRQQLRVNALCKARGPCLPDPAAGL